VELDNTRFKEELDVSYSTINFH